MNGKVVAIVQARMASTRLPGKVLADIGGHPMLWHVINRAKAARTVDQIVVATSASSADNPIFDFCAQQGIACFRGNETDVLDRLYQAARKFRADIVIRLTADCPLVDPQVIDKVANTYLKGGYDYVSNTLRYTYPDGLDVEVFSFQALEKAWREAVSFVEREHVTPYIRTSRLFNLGNVENDSDTSGQNNRWTVDEAADLEFIRAVYSRLGRKREIFEMADVMKLIEREPSLLEINKGFIRNEGYYRSLAREAPIAVQSRRLDKSQELKVKAQSLIPSCTQTFSKGPTQYVQGVSPVFLQRGQGSHVWDVDGNEYIDYPMALGAIILGHNYPAVTDAVARQIREGTTFSLPHPLEFEVADLLVKTIPCAEMVRFAKNGSDATSGAVRVARAYTNREIIACCGYHGWQDWYVGTTTRNKGVPKSVRELTIPFEYNDIGSLKRIFKGHPGQVAAVIMEPVGVVEPRHDFLQQVQEITDREGAVLIFDEIVSGFRFAKGGAQELYRITPDLGCFGKAMANGYPISAVVGKEDIMQLFDEVFFSFTSGGETGSLAAALATITEIRNRNVIDHLWEQGQKLKDGYNVLANEFGVKPYTECVGLPPRTVITFKDENGTESLVFKSLVQQECLKRGILFSGGQNLCYSHGNVDIEQTLRVYRTALEIMADAIKSGDALKRLEGEPIQPVFRRA